MSAATAARITCSPSAWWTGAWRTVIRCRWPTWRRRRRSGLGGDSGSGRTLMGLCLHVFAADFDEAEDPEELAECDVGHYSDFGCFRDTIAAHLDAKRFPILMEHSDSDGEWTLAQIPGLERELKEIGERFRQLPPAEPKGAFEHTAEYRQGASSLYDCFHNVSGENLFEALLAL